MSIVQLPSFDGGVTSAAEEQITIIYVCQDGKWVLVHDTHINQRTQTIFPLS